MAAEAYRYTFDDKTSLEEVRDSLFLAVFSAEGLHGRAQVRLDAAFWIDERRRTCVVDGATAVGQTVARIFTGLLSRQFGDDAYRVERVLEPFVPQEKTADGGGAR